MYVWVSTNVYRGMCGPPSSSTSNSSNARPQLQRHGLHLQRSVRNRTWAQSSIKLGTAVLMGVTNGPMGGATGAWRAPLLDWRVDLYTGEWTGQPPPTYSHDWQYLPRLGHAPQNLDGGLDVKRKYWNVLARMAMKDSFM